eukprot:8488018-Heterocapsa_arctica.AAC.1
MVRRGDRQVARPVEGRERHGSREEQLGRAQHLHLGPGGACEGEGRGRDPVMVAWESATKAS